jgi:putative membrane protein
MDVGLVAKSLVNLPAFAIYMAASLGMIAVFLGIYTALTPCREWTLLRQGNLAASISLGGAVLGFSLPLAAVIAHSNVLVDVIVWGVVAVAVQLLVWAIVNLLDGGLKDRIARGEAAAGVFLAATSLAGGIVNAACMTY